jgi:hypothetical protein
MKQLIEVDVPEGMRVIYQNGILIYEGYQPETWEEFVNLFPVKLDECYIDKDSSIKFDIQSRSKTLIPSEKYANSIIALIQLLQLRQCYNLDWKPNWQDFRQEKWIIVENLYGTLSIEKANIPNFLAFRSEELADKFLNNFRSLIEQYLYIV